jgi:plasmid maintenance system antidote protein VapI
MSYQPSHALLSLLMPSHPFLNQEIVLEKRKITADKALRLAKFFGTSPEFWIGLQSQYDLDVAADKLGERLEKEVKEYSEVV